MQSPFSQYLYIKLPPGLRIDKNENALAAAACAVKAITQNSAPALGRSIAKLRIRNAQRFRDRGACRSLAHGGRGLRVSAVVFDMRRRVEGIDIAVVSGDGNAHAVVNAPHAVFDALEFHCLHAAVSLARRKIHFAKAVGSQKITGYRLKLG